MKTALVTGGAQGIGKAICARFLRDGFRVVCVDCDEEALDEAAAEAGDPARFVPVPGDVSDEADVMGAVAAAAGRLDVLVNNAGIGIGKPVTELTLAEWNRVIGVNLTSIFLFARHAAPLLRAAHGAMVNISSTRALQSEPNTEAYSASKGGVVAITHALAASLAPDVRVTCICPGWIDTSATKKTSRRQPAVLSAADHLQHPCGRVGTPEDIASFAAFLAGPDAGFVTGSAFVVDGGMTRKMIYV